ncbi:MAG: Calx-beta domain-containing protein [Gemmataceae bacterium]
MKPLRTRFRKPAAPAPALRRRLEALEDRTVPATISVADVTVREGPATLGALDPSGAAAVGINGLRDLALAPNGDLLVGGYTSHSVARFNQASQTYESLIAPGSGGLGGYSGVAFDPTGNIYVASFEQDEVFRFDPTGAPLPGPGQPGALYAAGGGLSGLGNIGFGPDGNLYAVSSGTNQILRYMGPFGPSPGAFMDAFVSSPTPVNRLTFGPDHNLYVAGNAVVGQPTGIIRRYDGLTGQPIAGGVFVAAGSGGLHNTRQLIIDSQGTYLYVTETVSSGAVLRFQGPNGPTPGAFVDAYINQGQAGLSVPIGLALDAAGNLYVSERDLNRVTRFAPNLQASFAVTLNSVSTSLVMVNYATANGTAVAGTDYTAASGTLTFAPGVLSQTVNIPITTVLTGGPTKTFSLNLSGPVNATIADGQGVGSILNRQTKFFVADGGTPNTYQYGSGGTAEEITPEASADTAPRGVATTAAGDTVWVVDANRNVYVYTNHGVLLGSWTPGGLNPNAQLEGIATNGTDIWLLDNFSDKVYRYSGAASLLSGSQNAASSFSLVGGKSGNINPKGIVTDGTSFWVVNDGPSTDKTRDRVYKYTLAGATLGSWSIDAGNASPTGLTIDPTNVSNIWIVDNVSLKVYQYTGAATRTSGSQSASAKFALAAGNTNPQDIADPPAPEMLLPPMSVAKSTATPLEAPSADGLSVFAGVALASDEPHPARGVAREPFRSPEPLWVDPTVADARPPVPWARSTKGWMNPDAHDLGEQYSLDLI